MSNQSQANPWAAELKTAQELARQAGQAIMEHYKKGFAVEYKDAFGADPVTQADKDANAIIVEGLARTFPTDGILAEESPLSSERHQHRRLWCVDPLDGTQEFVAKNGQFVVMIGLAVDGEARVGVVYQPTEDLMFWGAGDRAFIERSGQTKPLLPSRKVEPAQAILMVSRSHRSQSVTQVAQRMGIEHEEPLGSVGLKVLRVAEGSAEMYLSMSNKTKEWDACAPEAILRAAGGRLTDMHGKPLRYNKESPITPYGLLATNGPLHPLALDAMGAASE